MSTKYDIVTNFLSWTPVGQTLEWPNPNARWYRPFLPKKITLSLYSKVLPASILYVWYNVDHDNVVVYGSEIATDR